MSSSSIWASSVSSSPGSSNPGSLKGPGQVTIDKFFNSLGKHELHHLNLALMEEPLDFLGSNLVTKHFTNTHGLVLKHDYILLQYTHNKWIKAEKGGESAPGMNDGGVVLSPLNLTDPEDLREIDGSTIRFQTNNIRLGKGKHRWTLTRMFTLLSNGDPGYDFMAENCWKHAFSSAEGVLNWCIDNAKRGHVRDALKAKLEELKVLERPTPLELLRSVVEPCDPRSVKTREKFRKKLEHTAEHLPKDATVRRLGVSVLQTLFDY